MSQPATINPRIVEALYCEALVLSDEVRAAFSPAAQGVPDDLDDLQRIALSCEGLRTTTRMMHAVAWLLNQRAYFAGELSEFQLRRYGKLAALPGPDPSRAHQLAPGLLRLIAATEDFYQRLARLDQGWRTPPETMPSALDQLRRRFGG